MQSYRKFNTKLLSYLGMKTQTIQRNPLSVIVYFPSLFGLRFGVTIFKAYPTFGIIWQGERKVCTASK